MSLSRGCFSLTLIFLSLSPSHSKGNKNISLGEDSKENKNKIPPVRGRLLHANMEMVQQGPCFLDSSGQKRSCF